MTVLLQLKEFIWQMRTRDFPANLWIEDKVMSVYVRRGHHNIDKNIGMRTTLDIANVTVQERYRSKGRFTKFVKQALKIQPWDGIFIESVLEPRLVEWCRTHNFIESIYQQPAFFIPSGTIISIAKNAQRRWGEK